MYVRDLTLETLNDVFQNSLLFARYFHSFSYTNAEQRDLVFRICGIAQNLTTCLVIHGKYFICVSIIINDLSKLKLICRLIDESFPAYLENHGVRYRRIVLFCNVGSPLTEQ